MSIPSEAIFITSQRRTSELIEERLPACMPEIGIVPNDPALEALAQFSTSVNDTEVFDHSVQVASILHDFFDSYFEHDRGVYSAVLLHDVIAHFNPDSLMRQNAERALRRYQELENDDVVRVRTQALLTDMAIVEEYASLSNLLGYREPLLNEILTGKADVESIPENLWLIEAKIVDLTQISKMLKVEVKTDEPTDNNDSEVTADVFEQELGPQVQVNIESALCKASEALNKLRNPSGNKAELIRDIFRAESFYAPLCEILGFDALSMALKDASAEHRFRFSGQEKYLVAARAILDSVPVQVHELILEKLFDPKNVAVGNVIGQTSADHSVSLHEVAVCDDDKVIRGVHREKSAGSLALKLLRKTIKAEASGTDIEGIKDVEGYVFIVSDINESITFFKKLIEKIKNKPNQFTLGRLTGQPIQIRGTSEFVVSHIESLGDDISIESEINTPDKSPFQLAKVVFDLEANGSLIPVEIMVQSVDDREAARSGAAFHAGYKAGDTASTPTEALTSISERKKWLRNGAKLVTAASIERSRSPYYRSVFAS